METFKEIENTNGLYLIGNYGTVKSVDRDIIQTNGKKYHKKEKILRIGLSDDGYPIVNLRINGKSAKKRVHRLIALAFIPNPNNKSEVNHKNGDVTDFSIENLEWVTRSENLKHSYDELGRTHYNKSKSTKVCKRYPR